MEFGADRCEARIAGTAAFLETAAKLLVYQTAARQAFQSLNAMGYHRRMVRNLPNLIDDLARRIDAPLQEQLNRSLHQGVTRPFDTHPCMADRIRQVEILAEPGVALPEAQAASLFVDYPRLCEEITRHIYSSPAIDPNDSDGLVPNESILHEQSCHRSDCDNLAEFAPGFGLIWRPFPLEIEGTESQRTLGELRTESVRCRQWVDKHREQISEQSREHAALLSSLDRLVVGESLRITEIPMTPDEVELAGRAEGTEWAQNRLVILVEEMKMADAVVGSRFTTALGALLQAGILSSHLATHGPRAECRELVGLVLKLQGLMEPLIELRQRLYAFRIILERVETSARPAKAELELLRLIKGIRTAIARVRGGLLGVRHPFCPGAGRVMLNDYCGCASLEGAGDDQIYQAGVRYARVLPELYNRAIARIASHALKAEGELLSAAGINGDPPPSPGAG
jgi:hypothetical protein